MIEGTIRRSETGPVSPGLAARVEEMPQRLSQFEQPVDRSQAHGGCASPHYCSVLYRQIGDHLRRSMLWADNFTSQTLACSIFAAFLVMRLSATIRQVASFPNTQNRTPNTYSVRQAPITLEPNNLITRCHGMAGSIFLPNTQYLMPITGPQHLLSVCKRRFHLQ